MIIKRACPENNSYYYKQYIQFIASIFTRSHRLLADILKKAFLKYSIQNSSELASTNFFDQDYGVSLKVFYFVRDFENDTLSRCLYHFRINIKSAQFRRIDDSPLGCNYFFNPHFYRFTYRRVASICIMIVGNQNVRFREIGCDISFRNVIRYN